MQNRPVSDMPMKRLPVANNNSFVNSDLPDNMLRNPNVMKHAMDIHYINQRNESMAVVSRPKYDMHSAVARETLNREAAVKGTSWL